MSRSCHRQSFLPLISIPACTRDLETDFRASASPACMDRKGQFSPVATSSSPRDERRWLRRTPRRRAACPSQPCPLHVHLPSLDHPLGQRQHSETEPLTVFPWQGAPRLCFDLRHPGDQAPDHRSLRARRSQKVSTVEAPGDWVPSAENNRLHRSRRQQVTTSRCWPQRPNTLPWPRLVPRARPTPTIRAHSALQLPPRSRKDLDTAARPSRSCRRCRTI